MAFTTTALLITAAVASIAGAGVSAYSSVQAGKAQQSLNNYNAAVSEQDAADAARNGRIQADAQRAQNEKIKARQRALFAKAGVVTATGTPLMVQTQQAGELEMAALETEQSANVQAARLRTQAVIDRMAGSSARRAGNLNAGATLLQGAAQAASYGSAAYKSYKGTT